MSSSVFTRPRKSRSLVGVGVAAATGLAALCSALPAAAMDGYRGKYRPLIVFAAAPDSRELTRQRQAFAGQAAQFKDRNIVVVSVIGNQLWNWLGPGPSMTTTELRDRFGIGRREFRAILIGKDGGVKLSSSQPLTAQKLYETIDAMPMRRQEMRAR